MLESRGRRLLTRAVLAEFDKGPPVPRIPEGECIRRVLLMRWDAIGDMVVSLPFFRALAELHPDTEFCIVVSRRNRDILKHEGTFSTILWDRNPMVFLRSLLLARAFRPDAVVDTRMHYDSTTSFLYASVSGARWSVSASNRSNRLPFTVRVPVGEADHFADMTGRLLSALGPSLDGIEPDRKIRLSAEERFFASDFWRGSGISLIGRTVGVNISARDPSKKWGPLKSAELCRILVARGLTPVLLSSPEDRDALMEICSGVEGTLAGPETPTVLHAAALLEGLAILVTPDTAMVHVAAAHGIPVVGLYRVTESHMPTWQPWRDQGAGSSRRVGRWHRLGPRGSGAAPISSWRSPSRPAML